MSNIFIRKHLGFALVSVLFLSGCLSVDSPSVATLPVENSTSESISDVTSTTLENDNVNSSPTQVSQPKPTPTIDTCIFEEGELVESSLATDNSEYPLDFIVYLPPCYSQQIGGYYPVLYLIHGQSYLQDQWIRLGAADTANRLILSGEMTPLIIVMPRDRDWGQPSVDIFGEVFIDLLIPYMDATYRTIPDRAYRAIGGLSRGGGWAINLGFKNWELFSIIGLHSPAILWEDKSSLSGWIEDIPTESFPRLFLDVRDRDINYSKESVILLESIFSQHQLPYTLYEVEGYHNEDSWGNYIERYMRFYTLDW